MARYIFEERTNFGPTTYENLNFQHCNYLAISRDLSEMSFELAHIPNVRSIVIFVMFLLSLGFASIHATFEPKTRIYISSSQNFKHFGSIRFNWEAWRISFTTFKSIWWSKRGDRHKDLHISRGLFHPPNNAQGDLTVSGRTNAMFASNENIQEQPLIL